MSWYESAPSAAVKALDLGDHEHSIDLSLAGDELRCGTCGGRLAIVCKGKGCADPLERVRKSKGPIPPAPRFEEKVKPRRLCPDCESPLPKKSLAQRCDSCKAKRDPPRPKPEQLPDGMRRCTRCKKVKPLRDFYFNKAVPYSNCKPCWNEYVAERKKGKAAA